MPVVKNLPANAGDTRDTGSVPGLGRSPGGGNGNPLQYLAWRIPWTEGPGRLQSTGSQRVRHDWVTNTKTKSWQIPAVSVRTLSLWRCLWCISIGFLKQTSIPLEKYKHKSDFQSKKSGKQPGACLQKWKQDVHEIKIRGNKWARTVYMCVCMCVIAAHSSPSEDISQ